MSHSDMSLESQIRSLDRPRKRLAFYKPSERIAELCGLRPGQPWGAA
jgi:hypothetical protein